MTERIVLEKAVRMRLTWCLSSVSRLIWRFSRTQNNGPTVLYIIMRISMLLFDIFYFKIWTDMLPTCIYILVLIIQKRGPKRSTCLAGPAIDVIQCIPLLFARFNTSYYINLSKEVNGWVQISNCKTQNHNNYSPSPSSILMVSQGPG